MKKHAGGHRTAERAQGKPPGKSGVNKNIRDIRPPVKKTMSEEHTRAPNQRQKLT